MADDPEALLSDFSLWRSGPLYRLERALGLAREDRHDLGRRVAALALVGWVPTLALALGRGLFTGRWDPLLAHFEIYVRWLFAVPVLLLSGDVADLRIRDVLQYLREAKIVDDAEDETLAANEAATQRWARSATVEGALAALAPITGLPGVLSLATPAQWWQHFVGLSLFRFLIYRWLWRWLLWAILLGRIARLELRLVGLHPDRAGGLGLTAHPSRAVALVALGGAAVLSATWSSQVLYRGAHAQDFAASGLIFLAIVFTVALGPLLVFAPALVRARREHLRRHGDLAAAYVRGFAARWWSPSRGDPLGSQDIQSLADLQGSFGPLAEMRGAPIERQLVVQLAIFTLVPFVPLALTAVPFSELLKHMLKALLGG